MRGKVIPPIQISAGKRLAVRMLQAEKSLEVPVPSFCFHVITRNPSVTELPHEDRMLFLAAEWKKLSKPKKNSFLKAPLKGIIQ